MPGFVEVIERLKSTCKLFVLTRAIELLQRRVGALSDSCNQYSEEARSCQGVCGCTAVSPVLDPARGRSFALKASKIAKFGFSFRVLEDLSAADS